MNYEMDDRMPILLKMASEAMNSHDQTGINKVAHYNAEMGNFMITFYEDRLSLEQKCEIAMYHYSGHGDNYPAIRKYVRKARIIRPENWRAELPTSVRDLDTFIVYRGGSEEIGKAAYSMSWTLSQEVAEWFMKRHELTHPGEQHLYRGSISADKIIAYIRDRNEFEIVQYRGVKNIEEISLVGLSQEFENLRNFSSPFAMPDLDAESKYFDKWYNENMIKA